MDIKEQFIQVNNQNICYYTAGEQGSPVVLLHGGGVDSALLTWRCAIPTLAQEHIVYAPDFPGYGKSDPMRGIYTTEKLIEIVDLLLEAWELRRFYLAGLSMGGAAALGFALQHPERVIRLALIDSYGLQDRVSAHYLAYLFVKAPVLTKWTYALLRRSRWMTKWSLQSIFGDPGRVTEALVDEVFQVIKDQGVADAFYSWQVDELTPTRLKTCYADRLKELQPETLIIHGSRDRLVPLADAHKAAAAVPDARLEVIEGAGHWPARERPEEINRLLLHFFNINDHSSHSAEE